MDGIHEKPKDPDKSRNKHAAQPLRYRTRALWLLGFYILLIVVPWVLTCLLAHRPINAASYVRQQGFRDQEVTTMRNWNSAVGVLNAIAGLITSTQYVYDVLPTTHTNYVNYYLVPVLSAVLAQAAVLFCQRRKTNEFLSLRDMFALADRGWTNAPLIWKSIWTRPSIPGEKSSAAFLLPAACLIILGAVQQPLYQILVGVSTTSVVTCRDVPSWFQFSNCTGRQLYGEVGRDIEPAQLAVSRHLLMRSRVDSGLASISVDDAQPYLWSVNATYKPNVDTFGHLAAPGLSTLRRWVFERQTLSYWELDGPVPEFFVASLPAGTTTGVLRQHLMRLNSSVSCEEIDSSEFPSPCPGDRPFNVSWQRVIDTDVRICVPGDYTTFPWTLSRSRQEHMEEIYIDINDTSLGTSQFDSLNSQSNTSYSIHCTATTTRGYFELGNDQNKNTHEPILEQWPTEAQMQENFNDWTDDLDEDYVPSEVYVNTSMI